MRYLAHRYRLYIFCHILENIYEKQLKVVVGASHTGHALRRV
jgi:hypothetical protein